MGRKRLLEALVVVALLSGMMALLYPAVRAAREASLFPDGPYGELIPNAAPEERNRITHASGVSIVVPKNWERIDRRPFLCITARVSGARLRSLIAIQKSDPTDVVLATWARTTFHGLPGYERMEVEREAVLLDDPGSSRYALYVDAGGEWWLIEFAVADVIRTLPSQIKAYIDTVTLPTAASEPKDAGERG